jgi:hypothetical protein
MDERYKGIEEKMAQLEVGLSLQERIELLGRLSDYLATGSEALEACIELTYLENKWLTQENTHLAISSIREAFLDTKKLAIWSQDYGIQAFRGTPKTVGIVMAGNIPLVGFHDALCVFISGHKTLIKLSDKDKRLFPHLIEVMTGFDARVADYFEFGERMNHVDAVIATGSNNSARYFEAYFAKYPHIIRKNRNAIAVLNGSETKDELIALGKDIFMYFGLGCRNVSKVYLPKGYVVENLCEVLHDEYKEIVMHDKYKNNFDYNYTLFALNKIKFFTTGGLIVTENASLQSRIAALHYEFYDDIETLENQLVAQQEDIQCIASWVQLRGLKTVPLGATQQPSLYDYPDGVDVMEFLATNV